MAEETIKMNLMNDIGIGNLQGMSKFKRGQGVNVPKSMADEVARMDYEASQAKADLVRQPKEFTVPIGIDPLSGQRWQN